MAEGDTHPVWRHCCSFLDLSLEEFVAVQEHKWREQMDLLCRCPLGRRLVGDRPPRDLAEFSERVPFTTYDDYEPELSERQEDVLPEKPHTWMRTSGIGDREKWIPLTEAQYHVGIDGIDDRRRAYRVTPSPEEPVILDFEGMEVAVAD
ncbi:MAG: GH3 auxin-responsive promoter family protein, partial [Chloroflexota bacterium]|nr:GH3 auxin-responsive promoter family protein [Chloroflexota bacterium]